MLRAAFAFRSIHALVGSTRLQAKGNIQKNLGKVQAKYGDLKKKSEGFPE